MHIKVVGGEKSYCGEGGDVMSTRDIKRQTKPTKACAKCMRKYTEHVFEMWKERCRCSMDGAVKTSKIG